MIGHINILQRMTWSDLDLILASCVESYFDEVDQGLRTKKTCRLDPENSGDNSDFTLGLNSDSICGYTLGK